jgi:hypothetical protein
MVITYRQKFLFAKALAERNLSMFGKSAKAVPSLQCGARCGGVLSRSRVRPFECRLSRPANQRRTKQKIVNRLLFKLRTPRRRARPDRTDRPMRGGGGCGSTFFAVVCGCSARALITGEDYLSPILPDLPRWHPSFAFPRRSLRSGA